MKNKNIEEDCRKCHNRVYCINQAYKNGEIEDLNYDNTNLKNKNCSTIIYGGIKWKK